MIRRKHARQLASLLIVAAIAIYQYFQSGAPEQTASGNAQDSGRQTNSQWIPGQWVRIEGHVSRLLGNDNEGSRHQRFIITLPDRRTLLVAHNIDLATPVPVKINQPVTLKGRYETNSRGGVIHWTHHDPQGGAGGWIEYRGKRYQ